MGNPPVIYKWEPDSRHVAAYQKILFGNLCKIAMEHHHFQVVNERAKWGMVIY